MSSIFKTGLAALAFAAVLPLGAQAATIKGFNLKSEELVTGNSYAELWETGDTSWWRIAGFSFTLNSTVGATDLALVTIDFTGGEQRSYDISDFTLDSANGVTNATLLTGGFLAKEDFIITLSYAAGGQENIAANYVFRATEVAPVPLPAAGFLLLGALSGAGLVARRRKA